MMIRCGVLSPKFFVRFAILLVVTGCGPAESGQTHSIVTDSAGVAIWSLGNTVTDLASTPVKVGALSLPDSGWKVEEDGVAVDPSGGRVYVLDELGPRVLAFTHEGAWIGEIGRAGEGPGEYEMPTAIDVDSEGTLWVVDASRSLLLSWDRDGHFIGQERLPVAYWGPGFQRTDDAQLYVRGDQGGETGNVVEGLVRTSEGEGFSDLMSLEQPWTPANTPCGNMAIPLVLAPSIIWNGNARYTVAASWPDYRLQVFEGDSLVASLRRDMPPLSISEGEAEAFVAAGPHSFLIESCNMTSEAVLRTAGFVERVSPIDRIAVDPLNRIWTRTTGLAGKESRVELFNLEQGYLGSWDTSSFPVAFVTEDRYLSISEGSWGTSIEIWNIVGG